MQVTINPDNTATFTCDIEIMHAILVSRMVCCAEYRCEAREKGDRSGAKYWRHQTENMLKMLAEIKPRLPKLSG